MDCAERRTHKTRVPGWRGQAQQLRRDAEEQAARAAIGPGPGARTRTELHDEDQVGLRDDGAELVRDERVNNARQDLRLLLVAREQSRKRT
eukprot:1260253-Pleurochrysis_carterae.AAC.3